MTKTTSLIFPSLSSLVITYFSLEFGILWFSVGELVFGIVRISLTFCLSCGYETGHPFIFCNVTQNMFQGLPVTELSEVLLRTGI